jgi:hypothetical protein
VPDAVRESQPVGVRNGKERSVKGADVDQTNEMTAALAEGAQYKAKAPSMTGDSLQKLDWHIMRMEYDLEGARALRDAFPLLPEAAQRYLMNLLQRGMR